MQMQNPQALKLLIKHEVPLFEGNGVKSIFSALNHSDASFFEQILTIPDFVGINSPDMVRLT